MCGTVEDNGSTLETPTVELKILREIAGVSDGDERLESRGRRAGGRPTDNSGRRKLRGLRVAISVPSSIEIERRPSAFVGLHCH